MAREATLDHHIQEAQQDMSALVLALRDDAGLAASVRQHLAHYETLDRAGRLAACWVSRRGQKTLQAAWDAAFNAPGVPAGDMNV